MTDKHQEQALDLLFEVGELARIYAERAERDDPLGAMSEFGIERMILKLVRAQVHMSIAEKEKEKS